MGIVSKERAAGKDWLDSSGCFLFGKYGPKDGKPGQLAEDIASSDPGYVRWVIDNIEDISGEDRGLLEQYLSWKNRGKR